MQQDKTDWYWNGVLAGAVNNLYYDFINVDVVHVPYATTNRNSSFFLQTRRSYIPSKKWLSEDNEHRDWDVVDTKYIWDKTCDRNNGWVYVLLANKSRSKICVNVAPIEDGCVQEFNWLETKEYPVFNCGCFKLFTTSYVKGENHCPQELIYNPDKADPEDPDKEPVDICDSVGDCDDFSSIERFSGIQINKYKGGTTYGLFSDEAIKNNEGKFRQAGQSTECPGVGIGDYILVYDSRNDEDDGFAGQVRMVTGFEDGRIVVDAPWQGFETPEGTTGEVEKGKVKYRIFKDWGSTVGFTDGRQAYIVNAYGAPDNYGINVCPVYRHDGPTPTSIISVVDVADRMYILTDNGWVHYSKEVGYNKFFITDDVFAGSDKLALTEYRDILIAFGDKHIAIGVPSEGTEFENLYNQSATIGLWSRYSFAEYDGDLIFVSNDKRLLALGIAQNSGKYMLQCEDVGEMINSKLSILTAGDEVFIGNDNNDLRVFINTKSFPFYNNYEDDEKRKADTTGNIDNKYEQKNTMTRIIKFDKQFKVWTEDWVQGILIQGTEGGIYFGESGLYVRARGGIDIKGNVDQHERPFQTYISAYLMENESDWVGGNNSWLANRPKLYNLAKLNRLITTLGPGIYTTGSKIRITAYNKGLGTVYEFAVNGDNNDWLGLITTKFTQNEFSEKDMEKLECMNTVLQDNKKNYQPKCTGTPYAAIQNLAQAQPWCDSYGELLTFDKGVCIDDSLYELAPTMPLMTALGENQDYSSQIKLELIGGAGDVISFGGWLGELFTAPLFTTGPDGEYQLQPNTDCE